VTTLLSELVEDAILQEACVCRRHDSGPIEPDKAPARPARSSLDRCRPAYGNHHPEQTGQADGALAAH
jgi:hypothetical protein